MQLTTLAWLGGLLGLAQGYVYGSSGLYTGTDPSSGIPSTSAPYGNYTWSYPTGGSTGAPYPYPSGTVGTAVSSTDPGTAYSTGVASTGDPSTKTIASTGDPSGSGKLTYTAPTGIPTEYYYHHKKPKRNGFYHGWGYRA